MKPSTLVANILILLCAGLTVSITSGQTYLQADGSSDTYCPLKLRSVQEFALFGQKLRPPKTIMGMRSRATPLAQSSFWGRSFCPNSANPCTDLSFSGQYALINRVMGAYGTGENPDCSHPSFGRHISQGNDGQLSRQVFFFHSHVNEDNDRCQNFDRQRNEIRPDKGGLTGNLGETVSHSWNFKLDAGFQPSSSFTHIYQIKAVGGSDAQPLITFTPRYKSGGNQMELIHTNSDGGITTLRSVNLAPFLGVWVHAVSTATYGWAGAGKYSVRLSLLSNGQTLLDYSNDGIQMWRSGGEYCRPKWGIYRSLNDRARLRNEIVRFDTFCVGKGNVRCS